MNEKQVFNSLIRSDFYSFVKKVFHEVTGGEEFIESWHIELICDTLERCRKGEIKRLIINVPPRSLKSIITNVAFPAWLLGHDPKEKMICASYAFDLSDKFARDTKAVINSNWYKEIFPATRLSKARHTASDFNTCARGCRFATSVEGTLTGRGGNFIIIDDPIKPIDIYSETTLPKVNQWYKNTLLSRLNNKETGCLIVIMQRLHENDLSGYLLENEEGWHHLKIPAIAEEDEVWQLSNGTTIKRKRGSVINKSQLSKETLLGYKKTMGSVVFEGQYQQNPAPIEGAIIKSKWFKYYTQEDLPNFQRIIISWDTANKTKETNAYSACCIFGLSDSDEYYLLDVYRGRLELPDLLRKVKSIYSQYKNRYSNKAVDLLIEDAASGTHLLQHLKDERIYCIAIKPEGDKLSRFKNASVIVERGDVFVPKTKQSWWADFENEMIRFPNSKYKDQADSFAQALSKYRKKIACAW